MSRTFARRMLPVGWVFFLALAHVGGAWAGPGYDRIVICVDPLNMPYSALGEDPPGFDIEIGKAIGRLLKRETGIFWQDTGTRGGISRALNRSIRKGKCNAFMGIPGGEEMERELHEKGLVLTKPYMVASEVVVVRKDSPKVKTLDDLEKLNTGVQLGTLGQGILIRRGFRRSFYRTPDEVLEALEKGEVDVALMFGSIVQWTIFQHFQGRLEISKEFEPGLENRWNIGIAVRAEDEELKADLDRAIAQLWSEGKIASILAKYGVRSVRPVTE